MLAEMLCRHGAARAAVAVICVAGCNALSGVSDLEFERSSSGGASSSATVGSSGTGASGAQGGGGHAGGAGGMAPGGEGGAGGTGGLGGGGAGAGGAPGLLPVSCKGAQCAAGDICCHDQAAADPANDFCSLPGSCPAGFGEATCGGPAHCPGQVCCQIWGLAQDSTQGTICKSACAPAPSEFLMCSGDPSVCPNGHPCVPSANLGAGYSWCDPP
jgi:hypothetical protein